MTNKLFQNLKKSTFLFILLLLIWCLPSKSSGITYLRVLVEGEEVDTINQGETYFFEFDCTPLARIYIILVPDDNGNGIIDEGEESLLDYLSYFEDNRFPDDLERGPWFDTDSTEGLVFTRMQFYAPAGDWIFGFHEEDGDSAYQKVTFVSPYPATMSYSGTVTLEGLELPDHRLEELIFFALSLSGDSVGTICICDSMGDFGFEWFGLPGHLNFNFINDYYYPELPEYSFFGHDSVIYIDGHMTGHLIYIPLFTPDTARIHGYLGSSRGGGISAESLFIFSYRETFGLDTLFDIVYFSISEGIIDFEIPFTFRGAPNMNGILDYYNFPEGYLRPESYSIPVSLNFETLRDDPEAEYSDTLYHINDTLWLTYTYDAVTTPIYIDLPIKVESHYGRVNTLIPPSTILPVPVYGIEEEYGFNSYSISLDCDTCLPDNYGFHRSEYPGVLVRDTLELILGEMNTLVAGSLYSYSGERIIVDIDLMITEYETDDLTAWGWDSWIYVENGVFARRFFDNIYYGFQIMNSIEGYMDPVRFFEIFPPGTQPFYIRFYPLDSVYWLYIEIDSDDPVDDSLLVTITSPDGSAKLSQKCRTNRWNTMRIYSGFSEPCLLEISNTMLFESYPPFTRLIENNGNIPVRLEDSVFISVIVPVDYCFANVVEDTADSWQHTLSPYSLKFDYYIDDTNLIYTYFPINGYSLQLPIFPEQMRVKPVSKDWVWALHYFIANPEGFILGGAYRPESRTIYLNKGSGEMLIQFNGYDPHYLGADTIFLEYGTLSGIEIPEYPGHQYITDFFLFRMVPTHHPYGYGTVMAFHDVCDGEWTVNFPDTLPGGFIPVVSETSFYCEDISSYPDEWQEFEIQIPIISPPGVHGYINREMRFLQADLFRMDFFSTETDSLVASKWSWQYYAWGPISIYVKYFITEDELPAGNYYVIPTYTGYHDRELFIYPDTAEFAYSGDSLTVPDFYIGRTRGFVKVIISHLPSELYPDSRIQLSMPTPYHPEDIDFYDVVAEYHIPGSDSILMLNIPAGSWLIKPFVPYGVSSTPVETLLIIPHDVVDTYFVEFSFGEVTNEGFVYGNLVTENDDPSPVQLDSFSVSMVSLEGPITLRETSVDELGYFEFDEVYSPASFTLMFDYSNPRNIFYEYNSILTEIATAETLNLGELYVDNANAEIIIEFEDVDEERLGLIYYINFLPTDLVYIDDTLKLSYNTGFEVDTITICDGIWHISPPVLPAITLEPPETTLIIDESFSTYHVVFTNPEGITYKTPKPYDFSLSAYPNPFNKNLVLNFTISEPAWVILEIYNLQGKKVNTLIEDFYQIGTHQVTWNGLSEHQTQLSSGLYFFKIITNNNIKIVKGLFIK